MTRYQASNPIRVPEQSTLAGMTSLCGDFDDWYTREGHNSACNGRQGIDCEILASHGHSMIVHLSEGKAACHDIALVVYMHIASSCGVISMHER